LKSFTLKLRQEKEKKESRNLLEWCMIDASNSKMHKENTDAKCAIFLERENAEMRFP